MISQSNCGQGQNQTCPNQHKPNILNQRIFVNAILANRRFTQISTLKVDILK